MNDEQAQHGGRVGGDGDRHGGGCGFEEELRSLLADDAFAIRPSSAPFPAIRHEGLRQRRRRAAAAGAVLATLTAAPVGAYALTGGGSAQPAASPAPRPSVTASAPQSPTPTPTGAQGPGTPGRLLDGVTLEQARTGVEDCLAAEPNGGVSGGSGLGRPEEYRILLAMRGTGDSNAPGDGHVVVAVRDQQSVRLICTVKEGQAPGRNVSTGGAGAPGDRPVVPDVNAHRLYSQSVLDRGDWKLPFRWGSIGTVDASVARVTVSYGDETREAALDGGWFVTAGELDRQVTRAPHIKGYDAAGKLVYDSDHDAHYMSTLP